MIDISQKSHVKICAKTINAHPGLSCRDAVAGPGQWQPEPGAASVHREASGARAGAGRGSATRPRALVTAHLHPRLPPAVELTRITFCCLFSALDLSVRPLEVCVRQPWAPCGSPSITGPVSRIMGQERLGTIPSARKSRGGNRRGRRPHCPLFIYF